MKAKIINLFGGPGAGKSTMAASIFTELKLNGQKAELVLEFAKDLVWEERLKTLENQIYVFGKQLQRIKRIADKVDYIVSDSPLPLSVLYKPQDLSPTFDQLVIEVFNSFDNINFFIDRQKKYVHDGRLQTEEEAKKLDKKMLELLKMYDISYVSVPGAVPRVSQIVSEIIELSLSSTKS